jgi:hypothetical protein
MLLLLRLLERVPIDAHVVDLDWDVSEDREQPVITFHAGVGTNATHLGSATATELGLPASIDNLRRGFNASAVLPEYLRAALLALLNPDSSYPLYIHFSRKDGYLAMMNWEAMLRPVVGDRRRIRRLPYFSLPSVACAPNDLALLIDPTLTELSPQLHKIVGDVLSSFSMGNGDTFHVFASQSLTSRIHGLDDIRQPKKVHGYDPRKKHSDAMRPSHDTPAAIVESDFLRWVSETLNPSPVNSVVFVCQGGIELDEGVINFPNETNVEADAVPSSKSITADELTTFLMHLGASACAFVDPNPNLASGAGLRLLADRIAQSRPGLTAAFEPDERQGLHDFFFDVGLWPPWVVWPSPGGYLSYEFPWLELAGDRVVGTLEKFTLLRDLVSEYRKLTDVPYGGVTHTWRLPQEPVPRWLVAVQRHLEMWAARLLEGSDDDTVRYGIEDGVRSLRDSVRNYLQTTSTVSESSEKPSQANFAKGKHFETFDPEQQFSEVLPFCPPESRSSFLAISRDPSIRLAANVGGTATVNLRIPSDIYATLLEGDVFAEWTWMTFKPTAGKQVTLADVSSGIDTVKEQIVTYDNARGVLRVDARRLPEDEGWRLISLAYGPAFYEKAVIAIRRQTRRPDMPDDPAADVLGGYLLRAWLAAAERTDSWQPEGLAWLVGNVFAKMQSLIESDILPSVQLRSSEFEWVQDDLQEIADRRLDSIKQGVWDTFTN